MGYFEISLYNNLLDTFSPNFVVDVSNKIAGDSLFYERIPENKTLIITCLLNTVSTLIRHDYYTDAQLFLKRLKPLLDENHLLQKNQWHFLFGNLNVALGREKGYEIMKESIKIFKLLNCTSELERHLAGYKVIEDYYSKK